MGEDMRVEAAARAICKARGIDPNYVTIGTASSPPNPAIDCVMQRAWQREVEAARAALLAAEQAADAVSVQEGWRPISSAPRSYHPPLSQYNHHAPDILGLWGQSFYCVCSWGGPSNPHWIGGDNKPVPFQPTHWMPLPAAPSPDGGRDG